MSVTSKMNILSEHFVLKADRRQIEGRLQTTRHFGIFPCTGCRKHREMSLAFLGFLGNNRQVFFAAVFSAFPMTLLAVVRNPGPVCPPAPAFVRADTEDYSNSGGSHNSLQGREKCQVFLLFLTALKAIQTSSCLNAQFGGYAFTVSGSEHRIVYIKLMIIIGLTLQMH